MNVIIFPGRGPEGQLAMPSVSSTIRDSSQQHSRFNARSTLVGSVIGFLLEIEMERICFFTAAAGLRGVLYEHYVGATC